MSKNYNDPFENFRKFQRIVERMNLPLEQYQKQIRMIENLNIKPIPEALLSASNMTINISESIQAQQKLLGKIRLALPNSIDYSAIYSTMNSLTLSPAFNSVPKETHRLSETISRLISGLDLSSISVPEDASELIIPTFDKEKDEGKAGKLAAIITWPNVISFLAWFIPILITVLIEVGNNAQQKEIVELLKESNRLKQEEIDIMKIKIRDQEVVDAAFLDLFEQMKDALQEDDQNINKQE